MIPGVDRGEVVTIDAGSLLSVGISPRRPRRSDGKVSRGTMRKRIRTHFAGNASTSTLRRTVGALLGDELGLVLEPSGKRGRLTFGAGEAVLSDWLRAHAMVRWNP